MLIIKNLPQRCTYMLLTALVWLVPMTAHTQTKGQSPVDEPAGLPKIVFESLEHDFGTTKPNTPLTYNFIFKNEGTAALIIEKVKAG